MGAGHDHEGDLFAQSRHGAHAPFFLFCLLFSSSHDWRERQWGEYTHICLDKQLPCLYPFPQRSQRSSGAERLPSPLASCEPSLARRLRLLLLLERCLSMGVFPSTEVAPPPCSRLGVNVRLIAGSWLALFMLRER